MGCLRPDRGVQTRVQRTGRPRVDTALQVGRVHAPEHVEALGELPGTLVGSTRPGRTSGCSEVRKPAPTYASSPGHRSSDTGCSSPRRSNAPGLPDELFLSIL